MITEKTVYKHKTQYTYPFLIMQCFTNAKLELQYGTTQIRYNIRHINTYKLDTKVEDISTENTEYGVNI